MTTAYTYAPANAHTLPGHPESHRRLAGLLPFLQDHGGLDGVLRLEAAPAGIADLQRVHTPAYIEYVRRIAETGGGNLNPDTYVSPDSYELALLAVGACLQVVDHVLAQPGNNGLAIVRPPGHHASAGRGEGFCLFKDRKSTRLNS